MKNPWDYDPDDWYKLRLTSSNKFADILYDKRGMWSDYSQLYMYMKEIDKVLRMIQTEEVNCRRNKKESKKHKELVNRINEMTTTYQEMVMILCLSY